MIFRISSSSLHNAQCAFSPDHSCKGQFIDSWTLPDELGKGKCQRIHIRDGMDMYVARYTVRTDFTMDFLCSKPAFGFGFCVSGNMAGRSCRAERDVYTQGGQSQFFYFPDQTGQVTDGKGSYRLSVSVVLSPEKLHELLWHELEHMPKKIRDLADQGSDKEYNNTTSLTPEMITVVKNILSHPQKTCTSKIYYESKSLELISLCMDSLTSQNDLSVNENITSDQSKKIHYAADILLNTMDNPPSLSSLSRTVGMSHVKLNKGFKTIFGTTVFGYLRKQRMEQAKHLLEKKQYECNRGCFLRGI